MEAQNENLMCRIVDLIAATIRQSSYQEREELQEALSIFSQCVTETAPLDWITERELEEQIEWIHKYRDHQERYPSYRASPDNSLVPIMEDVDYLLPYFANEILKGAKAIAYMLKVHTWTQVPKRRRKNRRFDTYEECGSEPRESGEDSSDGELIGEAISYGYAYF